MNKSDFESLSRLLRLSAKPYMTSARYDELVLAAGQMCKKSNPRFDWDEFNKQARREQ